MTEPFRPFEDAHMDEDRDELAMGLREAMDRASAALEEEDIRRAADLLRRAVKAAEGFEAAAGTGEEEGTAPSAGERDGSASGEVPSALVWKATERDMRVFFLRNVTEVFEALRERYERAREAGDWEAQWAAFRGLGELIGLLARWKAPKPVL